MAQHRMLPSAAMGRDVHVWTYGHFGWPVVVFPTAAGFAHEWNAQGMIDVLKPLLAAGRIKLYCPESNVSEAWTKKDKDPSWRIGRHMAYERFILETLVPFIREDCNTDAIRIGVTGASLGGMYAATFALKHPEIFDWALCMSGRYEARNFTNGFDSPEVYHNNPLAFVPRLEGGELERVRKNTRLTLVCGRGKWEEGCIEETIELAAWLDRKGIPHERDLWGMDVAHDWNWWRRQAAYHFARRYGR
ncbi:MAG: prolyl oligopeptidase family serine peptidase [Alphaproteobacteria bacterium]|nr:prolyl oligopeptidase family serine peptidase [Alphaproteobacteria bacterium]